MDQKQQIKKQPGPLGEEFGTSGPELRGLAPRIQGIQFFLFLFAGLPDAGRTKFSKMFFLNILSSWYQEDQHKK